MELEDTMRNALGDAFDDLICSGAGTPQMILQNSTPETVITFDLDDTTAFGDCASGAITLEVGAGITSSTATGSETIAQAVIVDAASTTQCTLGVNTAGTPDLTLSSLVLATSETMTLTAFTVTILAGTAESGA